VAQYPGLAFIIDALQHWITGQEPGDDGGAGCGRRPFARRFSVALW
jgi:hypothetical protein